MKKYLLITTLLFLFSAVAFAQDRNDNSRGFYIGVTGGYAHNHLATSTGYRPFSKYEDRGGFVAGVPLGYKITEWFSVHAEILVVQKNYSRMRTEFYYYDPLPYENVRNTYLQLPVMPRFSFGGKNLRGFCTLGGFVGFWTGSHIKGLTLDNDIIPYHYNEKFSFDKRRDNRVEAGLAAGAGLEYNLKNFCTFVVEGRFYYGLTDLQKNYMIQQIPRYNSTITVQAGVHFNIARYFQKK